MPNSTSTVRGVLTGAVVALVTGKVVAGMLTGIKTDQRGQTVRKRFGK
jgi:mannose/fructose/N-acetylgalactosamine-specific phosphotransferase system component IIC